MDQINVKTRNKEEWRKMQDYLQKKGYTKAGDIKDSFAKYPIIVVCPQPKRYINVSLGLGLESITVKEFFLCL